MRARGVVGNGHSLEVDLIGGLIGAKSTFETTGTISGINNLTVNAGNNDPGNPDVYEMIVGPTTTTAQYNLITSGFQTYNVPLRLSDKIQRATFMGTAQTYTTKATFNYDFEASHADIVLTFLGDTHVTTGFKDFGSLLTDGGTDQQPSTTFIDTPNFVTDRFQTYDDRVVIDTNTTLAAPGRIAFLRTVNGNFSLDIKTPGETLFGGAVGDSQPLAKLGTDYAGLYHGHVQRRHNRFTGVRRRREPRRSRVDDGSRHQLWQDGGRTV